MSRSSKSALGRALKAVEAGHGDEDPEGEWGVDDIISAFLSCHLLVEHTKYCETTLALRESSEVRLSSFF
jgi:hypothetical protein